MATSVFSMRELLGIAPPPRRDPTSSWKVGRCTLRDPLLMVVPPGGADVECPVHGKHRVYPPPPHSL